MTTTTRIHVEIDDRLKQSPKLLDLIQKATEYFESEYADLPPDHQWGNALLEWYPTPGRDGSLSLRLSEEHSEYGGYIATVQLPVSQLSDEVSRNTWMRNLLRGVIRHRSEVAGKRIDRLILELGNDDV
jgi:hypothetical protein